MILKRAPQLKFSHIRHPVARSHKFPRVFLQNGHSNAGFAGSKKRCGFVHRQEASRISMPCSLASRARRSKKSTNVLLFQDRATQFSICASHIDPLLSAATRYLCVTFFASRTRPTRKGNRFPPATHDTLRATFFPGSYRGCP